MDDDDLVLFLSRTQPTSEDRFLAEAELRRRERRNGERIQASILAVLILTFVMTCLGLLMRRD